MTYQETLDYMFAQLPMYHRIGAAAYKADLQPTLHMMAALGNPQQKFLSIHVAGTNGKGSVSHFLASILQEAGYKVGLYTSPHLLDFRERIRINGKMIPRREVVDFVEQKLSTPHSPLSTLHLSFFEITVGMAFDYFARQQVDIAVVEVGMGGRLDSTNVVNPILSVITNIGLDHTQFLGDTLEKIALEKAGIIKDRVPVVIGETHPATAPLFLATAAAHHAPITFADQHYKVVSGERSAENGERSAESDEEEYIVTDLSTPRSPLPPLRSQLSGEYQKHNIATVLQAVHVLNSLPDAPFPLPADAVRRGLARVVSNTHLLGRWQKIDDRPLTICETAHNAPGIQAMLGKLRSIPFSRLHLVYGCVNDKDYTRILHFLNTQLSSLDIDFSFYFTQPSVPRGLPVDRLRAAAQALGIHGPAFQRVGEALTAARNAAQPHDLLLVTGSIFLVADALAFTNSGEPPD